MLVILGTKSKRKVEAVGQFVCPKCKEENGTKRDSCVSQIGTIHTQNGTERYNR